ncbi:MAG: epimerase, partial [Acidobacteriota bacterium]
VVHISITNPSEDSELEYFSGKARLERELMESGLSYSILRPTVLFGKEDILLNNIAWALRRLPVFGVFGDGKYRLQPIYVDDLAELAVREGHSQENRIIDAIGPETFTFRELVQTVGESIGKRRLILSVSPRVGYLAAWLIGKMVGDVFLTREEIAGLMQDLLCTDSEPSGKTKLTEWVRRHADELGVRYASELARRSNRLEAYRDI